jgi:hypothetical protein
MVLPSSTRVEPGAALTVHSSAQPTRPGPRIGNVQERQAGLPEPLRAFHRRLLARFLAHAGPPEPAAVAELAAELRLDPSWARGALAAGRSGATPSP